jgi:hypothetical protein
MKGAVKRKFFPQPGGHEDFYDSQLRDIASNCDRGL